MESTLGEIITFYSYKGGTGRSMALANIACLLARRRNISGDVLMIDWDLEAPGLHQFFHGRFESPNGGVGDLSHGQLGLIDLFYEIRNLLEKNESEHDVLENVFDVIDIHKYIIKTSLSSLLFMPAGRFDDGLYSARVNEFDWADFFNKYPLVITQFANYLRKKFKYVLIDSRTGYTDISGICTSIMPEKLVTVFTPNRQSLSGIVELIRRATDYRKQSDDLRPLIIFPLPSRIESGEDALQKDWRAGNSQRGIKGYQAQLESVLMNVYSLQECDLTRYFDEYQLQYKPKYSYGEEIAVLSERSGDRLSLARSFENFAEKIIGYESPWEEKEALTGLDLEHDKRGAETYKLSESINSSTRKVLIQVSMILLSITTVLVLIYFLGLPSIQSLRFLSNLLSSGYFGIVVIIFLCIDLIWIERWRNLLHRSSKLITKPWIFDEDKEPDAPPLYPRRILEQFAKSVSRDSKSETRLKVESDFGNDALSTWSRNIRNLVFDPEHPIRSLGYVISLVAFIFFLIADAITIANTLVLMGVISSNLPPILQRLDLAILGGALLTGVVGVWMLIEMSGSGELINAELEPAQKRIFKLFALTVTLFAVLVMLALTIQRLILLGYLQSTPTMQLILSFILFGILAINNSLSAALTFQPAASGLIVVIYLVIILVPAIAFLADIIGRVIYIVVDIAMWLVFTPIIAIPVGIEQLYKMVSKSL